MNLTAEDTASLNRLAWVGYSAAREDGEALRRMRHWGADCASRVLDVFESVYPDDPRLREAIIAAHQYADGDIDTAALLSALKGAVEAIPDGAEDGPWAAAQAGVRITAMNPAFQEVGEYPSYTRMDAAWACARAATLALPHGKERLGTWEREEAWQLDRLIYWLTSPSPEPLELPAPVTELAA